MRLSSFNAAPDEDLEPVLRDCCDVPVWAQSILAGRPYDDLDTLLDTADRVARTLEADDVERALAAHPRIGERAAANSTTARWSRQEQDAVSDDVAAQQALAEGNRAYERRFDRVFLICAAGLSHRQILDNLEARLGNDDVTEAAVTADELRKIALNRLRKVVHQ